MKIEDAVRKATANPTLDRFMEKLKTLPPTEIFPKLEFEEFMGLKAQKGYTASIITNVPDDMVTRVGCATFFGHPEATRKFRAGIEARGDAWRIPPGYRPRAGDPVAVKKRKSK